MLLDYVAMDEAREDEEDNTTPDTFNGDDFIDGAFNHLNAVEDDQGNPGYQGYEGYEVVSAGL